MQPEPVVEIRFHAEKASRGLYEEPQPLLAECAPVILVQRDDFLVGEWQGGGFAHPANQRELAAEAEAAVRAAFPSESLAQCAIRIFTCPRVIAARFNWNWPRR
jgi:hypothetical protein